MLSRIDGSGTKELVPRKQKQVNCNSYWTPDGNGVIYFSSENPDKLAQIYIKDIASGKRTRMPIPNKGVHATDPFLRGDLVVYPAHRPGKNEEGRIWIMRKDGKNARQLTGVRAVSYGDLDPKISPDMSRVAFYRYKSNKGEAGGVDLVMIDIKTGKETILSKPGNKDLDAMPEWSSDGKLLVFWHINRTDFKKSGIYTIRPDGTGRKMIPLPAGYLYTMPSFFPGEGSGKNARIIFSARKLHPAIVKKIWGVDK
jgi:Tol biopolymer transport system component